MPRSDATPFVPATNSLRALREAAQGCRGCPLHEPATQVVFGAGPRKAALMLFFIQLTLNFAWSPLFFAAHDIRLAKVVIFVMAALAAAAAGQFLRIRRTAGLLMVPYLGWLVFAATLNAAIQQLNPGTGTSLLG